MEVLTGDWEPLLSEGMTCEVMTQNSAPGVITLRYPMTGVRADQLTAGLIVRVRIQDGPLKIDLPPFALTDFRIDTARDRQTAIGVWSGVHDGVVKMRGCLVHINQFFGLPATFRVGNPGKVATEIKDDAADRGRLVRVGIIGTALTDAASLPWLGEYNQWLRMPYPESLMEVIDEMVNDTALEWDLVGSPTNDGEPDDTTWSWLRVFNPGNLGTDLTSVMPGDRPTAYTIGAGAVEAPLTESRFDRIDSLLGVGRDSDGNTLYAFASVPDNPVHPNDRLEAGWDFGEVASQATLDLRTERFLRAVQATLAEQVLNVELTPGVPVPLLNVRPGDWVHTITDGGDPQRRRIYTASLTRDADGDVKRGTVVLDGVINAHTVGLGRRVNRLDLRQQLLAGGAPT